MNRNNQPLSPKKLFRKSNPQTGSLPDNLYRLLVLDLLQIKTEAKAKLNKVSRHTKKRSVETLLRSEGKTELMVKKIIEFIAFLILETDGISY